MTPVQIFHKSKLQPWGDLSNHFEARPPNCSFPTTKDSPIFSRMCWTLQAQWGIKGVPKISSLHESHTWKGPLQHAKDQPNSCVPFCDSVTDQNFKQNLLEVTFLSHSVAVKQIRNKTQDQRIYVWYVCTQVRCICNSFFLPSNIIHAF